MTRQHLWCVGRVYLLFQDFLLWREGCELVGERLGDQRFVEAFVHRDPASVEAGVKCAALGLAYVSLHATAELWPAGDLSSLRRLIAIPRTTNQEVHPDHRDQPGGDCRSDRALLTDESVEELPRLGLGVDECDDDECAHDHRGEDLAQHLSPSCLLLL